MFILRAFQLLYYISTFSNALSHISFELSYLSCQYFSHETYHKYRSENYSINFHKINSTSRMYANGVRGESRKICATNLIASLVPVPATTVTPVTDDNINVYTHLR